MLGFFFGWRNHNAAGGASQEKFSKYIDFARSIMRALPAEEIPADLADAHMFVKACDLFDGFYHQLGEEDLRDAMGALSGDGEAVNLAKVMDEYVPFAQERYTRFQALLVRTVGRPPDSPVLCTAPCFLFGAWCVLARVADRRPRRNAVPTISPPHTSCSIFDAPTPLVCVCLSALRRRNRGRLRRQSCAAGSSRPTFAYRRVSRWTCRTTASSAI